MERPSCKKGRNGLQTTVSSALGNTPREFKASNFFFAYRTVPKSVGYPPQPRMHYPVSRKQV